MSFDIPPVGGGERPAPAPRAPAPQSANFEKTLEAAVTVNTVPASPPVSVLEEMNAAARVAEELRAQARELHFEPTESGRVVIQVRDLEGNVLRTIPPSEALDIAAGAPIG
jgi:flagellar protein FlaG